MAGASWFNERACHCAFTGTVVAVHFPQAFVLLRVPVPVCPTVQEKETEVYPLKETIKPSGESALPEEILRWLFHCFAG